MITSAMHIYIIEKMQNEIDGVLRSPFCTIVGLKIGPTSDWEMNDEWWQASQTKAGAWRKESHDPNVPLYYSHPP